MVIIMAKDKPQTIQEAETNLSSAQIDLDAAILNVNRQSELLNDAINDLRWAIKIETRDKKMSRFND